MPRPSVTVWGCVRPTLAQGIGNAWLLTGRQRKSAAPWRPVVIHPTWWGLRTIIVFIWRASLKNKPLSRGHWKGFILLGFEAILAFVLSLTPLIFVPLVITDFIFFPFPYFSLFLFHSVIVQSPTPITPCLLARLERDENALIDQGLRAPQWPLSEPDRCSSTGNLNRFEVSGLLARQLA